VIEEVEPVRQIADPMERAKQAGAMHTRLQIVSKEVSRIRREAIEELLRDGMSQTQIAAELGVTRGRVSQLAASGPPPERLFFGDDMITVAIGGKWEADKPEPGTVMAHEDFQTFERLKDLLRSLHLDAEAEVIPPPGMLRLNRDNFVVICGPRLSPLLGQVLESDPILGFEKDADGWHLVNRETRTIHRSPMDSGKNIDIAYFGRLPRPDGRGSFVYMAGIYAPGPGGVIHYLTSRLGELYREVRTHRFSTLVECEFDPTTGIATGSRRIAPVYVHEGR
jgi:predicted XRE-type DNA-binding protein